MDRVLIKLGSNTDPKDNNSNSNNNPIKSDDSSSSSSSSSNDNGDRDNNEKVLNSLGWVLGLGIALIITGAILLTLRSVVFSLILIIIGVSLFTYWLYVGARSKQQSHFVSEFGTVPTRARGKEEAVCICSICKHKESGVCLELRCACCILMRNKQIIGHFNNPLE
jgi:hypothetical protein